VNVGQLTAWIELNTKGFIAGLAKAKAGLAGLKKDLDGSSRNLRTLGDGLAAVGKPAAIFSLAGSAIALTAAIKPAVGAAWLLPAPIAAASAVAITAKAGMIGMGDAMKAIAKGDAKALAKAMQDMSPAGASFVRTLDGVNKKFVEVRKNTQQKLFGGLDQELSSLATTYLPLLDTGMGKVATSMNGWAKAASAAMQTPFMQGVAAQVFDTTSASMNAFTPAIGSIVTALGQVIKVGLPFVQQFADWAAKGLAAKAAFLGTAQGATYLHDKIAAGVAIFQQLGRITGSILTGLNNLLNGSQAAGMNLLGTIEQLAGKFAAWSATAEGQQRINDLMNAAVSIFKSLAVILPIFAGAISTIASVFASLPAPVQAVVAGFMVWGGILGIIMSRFAPLLSLLGRLGPMLIGAAGRWGLLGAAARTAATATGSSVGKILGAVGPSLLSGMGGMLSKLGPMFARIGPMLLSGLATLAPRIVPFILSAIAAVGRFVPGIGWVVSAIATVIGLIIANWSTVKTATVTAWNAVIAFIQTIPARIGAIISGLGAIISTAASTAWNWLVTTCQTAVMSVVNFLVGLPGQVMYALGFLAGMVYNAAVAAWNFLWNTLPAAIAAVGTWLASLPGQVGGWLASLASTVSSAASTAWQWLVTHATTFGNQALAFISSIPGKVGGFLASLPGIVSSAASSAWSAFLSTTQSVAQQALAFIQTIPTKIKGFFAGAASWLVSAGSAIINGLLNGLKAAAGAVLSYISSLAAKIKAGFNAAIHVNSPSKDFIKSALSIGEGLIVGLKEATPDILRHVGVLGASIVKAASNFPVPTIGIGVASLAGNRDLATLRGMAASGTLPASATNGTVINIHNPMAERSSDSINRAARVNALMGAF
jgi:phage-related protein